MCLPENCYYPASCKPDWRFDPDWNNQDLNEMYCKDPCFVNGCVSILVLSIEVLHHCFTFS